MNAAIIKVWRHLPCLRDLEFTATAGPGSATGWTGNGQAQVTPRTDHDGIRLFESGHFTPMGTATSVAFRNVYRWQDGGSRLSLWHERFGAEAPVWLFDLVATDHDTLVAAVPHHCGNDDYSALLRLVDDGIDLTWTITGPRKNDTLRYRYRFNAADGMAYDANESHRGLGL